MIRARLLVLLIVGMTLFPGSDCLAGRCWGRVYKCKPYRCRPILFRRRCYTNYHYHYHYTYKGHKVKDTWSPHTHKPIPAPEQVDPPKK